LLSYANLSVKDLKQKKYVKNEGRFSVGIGFAVFID
jgi:hypothetical protein